MRRLLALVAVVTLLVSSAAPVAAHGSSSPGSINGYPCGGNLPPCYVMWRESRGNPTAQNPTSSASGLWQFIHGTWNHYKGYNEAKYAPPSIQNEKARFVWAGGRGCSHWRAC
ncbi:MAG: transglycosylase SLT domain-containing protein [Acidimicrobiales bacterium]